MKLKVDTTTKPKVDMSEFEVKLVKKKYKVLFEEFIEILNAYLIQI